MARYETHGEVCRGRRWAILATLLLGTALAILDTSLLNISVVPIIEAFQSDLQTIKWVLTSYNLVLAVFMIGFGSLGDRVGRRRLYVIGQVVFVCGSVLATVARSPWQLIVFRALQGLGAAALAPNALALIREYFPERERGAALGIWSAAVALSFALGPTVGGLVAQSWGWRALFAMNLPVGLLVAVAAYGLLASDPPWRGQQFDRLGFCTLSGAISALAIAFTGMPPFQNAWWQGGFVILALVLGTGFVWVERRAVIPLVDLELLMRPAVIATNVTVLFAMLAMAGGMFLSVLYMQLLTNATPAAIGLSLAPCATATFVIAPVAGWLSEKVGLRLPVISGLLILTASAALPALWRPVSASSLVIWVNLLAGAGLGLAVPSLIRASTELVGQDRAGMGAGLYKSVNELGGVFGVLLLGTFLESRLIANALQKLPGHFLPQELSLKTLTSLTVLENHAVQQGLAPQELAGFHQTLIAALQQGFTQVFALTALLAVIGLVAGFLVPRQLSEVLDPGETP